MALHPVGLVSKGSGMDFRIVQSHQRALLGLADSQQQLALLWEMRLGKSLTVLRWLERHACRRVLIVSPASVLPSWMREIKLEGLKGRNLRDSPLPILGSSYNAPKQFCVINYELLRVRSQWLAYGWDAIILDESPVIRKPTTQISKLLCTRSQHIEYRAILSGQPMPESLEDVFQQYLFLHGSFMGCHNFYQWRERTHIKCAYDWIPRKGMRDRIMEAVRSCSHQLTRKAAGIGSKIIYATRYVELSPAQRAIYKSTLKDFEFGDKQTKWTLVVNTWLRQLAAGEHKDREIVKLLQGELKGEQLVIWFAFNIELYRLHERLEKLGIHCKFITGDVPISSRGKIVDQFNANKYQVLLMQLKCGKYGLDLSGADTAIYYSSSYEAETRIQSVPRIVHPKKDRPVLILDIVTKDTIDEDIREALLTKNIDSKGILSSSIKSALERELQRGH